MSARGQPAMVVCARCAAEMGPDVCPACGRVTEARATSPGDSA